MKWVLEHSVLNAEQETLESVCLNTQALVHVCATTKHAYTHYRSSTLFLCLAAYLLQRGASMLKQNRPVPNEAPTTPHTPSTTPKHKNTWPHSGATDTQQRSHCNQSTLRACQRPTQKHTQFNAIFIPRNAKYTHAHTHTCFLRTHARYIRAQPRHVRNVNC